MVSALLGRSFRSRITLRKNGWLSSISKTEFFTGGFFFKGQRGHGSGDTLGESHDQREPYGLQVQLGERSCGGDDSRDKKISGASENFINTGARLETAGTDGEKFLVAAAAEGGVNGHDGMARKFF